MGTGAVAAAALHADFDLAALATWAPGARVPFAFLAATFESISAESKRHAITRMLINAFRAVLATTPDDLLPAVYLCVNQARGALLAQNPRVCAWWVSPPCTRCSPERRPMQVCVSIVFPVLYLLRSCLRRMAPCARACSAHGRVARSEQVAAAHDGTELGIGDATLMNALATATGRSRDKVRRAADAHDVNGAMY